jgi:hypothetical protein
MDIRDGTTFDETFGNLDGWYDWIDAERSGFQVT